MTARFSCGTLTAVEVTSLGMTDIHTEDEATVETRVNELC